MPKIKPLSQIAEDSIPGDLIRFSLKGNKFLSYHIVEFQHGCTLLCSKYPPDNNDKKMVLSSTGKISPYMAEGKIYHAIGFENFN